MSTTEKHIKEKVIRIPVTQQHVIKILAPEVDQHNFKVNCSSWFAKILNALNGSWIHALQFNSAWNTDIVLCRFSRLASFEFKNYRLFLFLEYFSRFCFCNMYDNWN